jgi:MYXO-CTERM domain-containing protein
MAYGYHWSGSSYAGPTGKLRVTSAWSPAGSLSLVRSLANIGAAVGEDMRHKIVAGLPLYGREWTTPSGSWPSTADSHIGSVTYSAARALIAGGRTRSWDAGICNPAIIWQVGGVWHQVWYDDEQSLACKFDLVKQQNLGGMGYWALGYDNGYSEVWDMLETHFAAPLSLGEGSRDNPIRVTSFPYSDARNTATGGFRYFNYYSCRTDLPEYGREFVYQLDVCQPGSLTATVPNAAGIDPDIHLLSDLREDACIARAHLTFTQALAPGRYYLTVDTYVENSVELEGAYTLDVTYTPSGGAPCPGGTTCSAGACVCDGGLLWCGGACVDTLTNARHCGGCDLPCDAPDTCAGGTCVGDQPDAGPDGDTDADQDADAETDAQPDAEAPCDTCTTTTKCACRAAGGSDAPLPSALMFLTLVLGLALRRRRAVEF